MITFEPFYVCIMPQPLFMDIGKLILEHEYASFHAFHKDIRAINFWIYKIIVSSSPYMFNSINIFFP